VKQELHSLPVISFLYLLSSFYLLLAYFLVPVVFISELFVLCLDATNVVSFQQLLYFSHSPLIFFFFCYYNFFKDIFIRGGGEICSDVTPSFSMSFASSVILSGSYFPMIPSSV
jgi:hypothetical protein